SMIISVSNLVRRQLADFPFRYPRLSVSGWPRIQEQSGNRGVFICYATDKCGFDKNIIKQRVTFTCNLRKQKLNTKVLL
ncbi:MAG: hypothetical protein ACR2JB_25985, partial [Bryobacteraceae bacterium]